MTTATVTTKKRVGEILLEHGLVTSEQIEQALAAQKAGPDRKLLGEMIVELGFCTQDQVVGALAEAYDMPYAKLTLRHADPRVVGELPREFVEDRCVLPLFKVDGVLTVAIPEPSDLFLIEEISQLAGGPVQMVAAAASDIQAVLSGHGYDMGAELIDDLIQDAAADLGDDADGDKLDLASLDPAAEGSPVIKLANRIIHQAVREGASDIHIEPDDNQLRVRYRIDGGLVEKFRPPYPMHAPLISRIKIMASLDISERRLPQDGAIHVRMGGRPVDIRVSTLPNKFGEKLVLRIIDNSSVLVGLEDLGFDADTLARFRRQVSLPHGLVLVTGPTGSGKSTTLYAALAEINAPEINVCTVEDPIEFNLLNVNQFQVHEKIGFTFPTTLRSLLRQDPDVIMVGEIRDTETAKIAVQAALTGHMVFSTLHTNDAPSAVTRLYNVGVEPYLISASLEGVLAQRLVRRLCPDCREAVDPSPAVKRTAERLGQTVERAFTGAGCSRCRNTGFAGRVGIFEMLVLDDELRDAVTAGANLNTLRDHARRSGMKILLEDGFDKARRGQTTVEEVVRVTTA